MKLLYLILFQVTLGQGLVTLLLEGNDDQSNKDIDKKEREDHKVDHIEDGHLHPVAWTGTLVFKRSIHRVLQDTEGRDEMRSCHIFSLESYFYFLLVGSHYFFRQSY